MDKVEQCSIPTLQIIIHIGGANKWGWGLTYKIIKMQQIRKKM